MPENIRMAYRNLKKNHGRHTPGTDKKTINDIEKLVESVHTIANEIKHMREDLNDVKERVDIIEEKPAKRWDLVVTTVVTALVSGLFGMLLSNLIGG